jgi:hypothetical protein
MIMVTAMVATVRQARQRKDAADFKLWQDSAPTLSGLICSIKSSRFIPLFLA